ncbi:hypothetical protein ElyMa_001063600 [Elysia marginata]|uniref:Uncharacterized protein n=1 Tax=Elysia marginata TaxID=1093978 RepID=A0AAV4HTJ2_9GAST|nr:hypothetical protein ElyMa_001063600 [Elysia marginata]
MLLAVAVAVAAVAVTLVVVAVVLVVVVVEVVVVVGVVVVIHAPLSPSDLTLGLAFRQPLQLTGAGSSLGLSYLPETNQVHYLQCKAYGRYCIRFVQGSGVYRGVSGTESAACPYLVRARSCLVHVTQPAGHGGTGGIWCGLSRLPVLPSFVPDPADLGGIH